MTTSFPFNVFPGAGGNWQEIFTRWWSPNISLNFAGDAGVEREVNEDVASYGRQIGWLNDIVAALAKANPGALAGDARAEGSLASLTDAMKRIDDIKKRRKASAYDTARSALAKLGTSDKAAYKRLVTSLDPDNPPGASGQ
jgi:hypothetical protein